ncbi:MAG: ion transporter, partial [bacterium]
MLRVLKLAKSIPSLRVLLSTVAESMANVSYMTLLLFLFVFMFAVMGVQGGWGEPGFAALKSDVPTTRASLSHALRLSSAVFAGSFDRTEDTYHFGELVEGPPSPSGCPVV